MTAVKGGVLTVVATYVRRPFEHRAQRCQTGDQRNGAADVP